MGVTVVQKTDDKIIVPKVTDDSDSSKRILKLYPSESMDNGTLDEPAVFIDGVLSKNGVADLDPKTIESIYVWKDKPEYPNGRVDIKLKKKD